MRELGTPPEETQSWQDIVRIKEVNKLHIHKIVDGPKKVNTLFYPSMGENKEIKVAITVQDWKTSPFYEIAKIDRDIQVSNIRSTMGNTEQANEEVKKVRSKLDPSSSYHALILDKADEVPEVKHAEYRWGVFDAVTRAQREVYIDKDGVEHKETLKWGLLWMLWFGSKLVLKDESKKDTNFNHKYIAQVMEDMCVTKGKVSSLWLPKKGISMLLSGKEVIMKSPTKEVKIPVLDLGIFSEAEWNALMIYDKQIDDFIQPMDMKDVKDKITKYPLKLDGTQDGKLIFPHFEEIIKEVKRRSLSLPIYQEVSVPSLGIPEPEEKEEPKLPTETTEEPAAAPEPETATTNDPLADILGASGEEGNKGWSI